ncbi:type III PLP-dependent enzyme [Pseudonocardia asaccharolytica]|uniref:ornithine decarboxylase n=1 Tax=Pseudonocardia asaccharolytica DSM 44247 = NBRC 16224 TaxID=1123024 RepID=A0A511D1G2_9PSEU|nr:type III PLP-dependent enzyme [Pseudonocardia asaccharolytica]GEL16728.1 ornithine decarboxylase [Pseudonocardia asaccharolytica DSM 44247 = NBRC 16224]
MAPTSDVVSTRLAAFLADLDRATPYLVLDPDVVAARYGELTAAFPGAQVLYAVKACPEPAVLRTLAALGAGFDVASLPEIRLCLDAGADPAVLCLGNPVRGPETTAAAHAAGIRRFVTDSREDLADLARHAPGASVLVRVLVDDGGSATPFFGKFGALPAEAAELLRRAGAVGLRAAGVTFHAGSQQVRPAAYARAVRIALRVAGAGGLRRPVLDIGGGLPVGYRSTVRPPAEFGRVVDEAVAGVVRAGVVDGAELVLEPGRALVAEAGVLRTRVLRVSRRPGVDHRRWVYLDAGRYQGLAETEGEAIDYPLRVPGRSGPRGPVVLAGPTCDGDDVLYRRRSYALPLTLRAGDHVDLLHTGAYTASYASVGFNGFPPLPVHVT